MRAKDMGHLVLLKEFMNYTGSESISGAAIVTREYMLKES
jgi:hypothetical protein